jgi:hypothetical protein
MVFANQKMDDDNNFIGHDQGITIVEHYDTMSLYPMFMKCY